MILPRMLMQGPRYLTSPAQTYNPWERKHVNLENLEATHRAGVGLMSTGGRCHSSRGALRCYGQCPTGIPRSSWYRDAACR